MPNQEKTSLDVVMPVEVKEILNLLAEKRQRESKHKVYASDIVREALQEYFDRLGILVAVKVDRGGYRRPDSQESV